MYKIDAHQSFWNTESAAIKHMIQSFPHLAQNFLPNSGLEQAMKKAGFDVAVVVQIENSLSHTEFLLKLGEKYDFIQGIVAWEDFWTQDIEAKLNHWTQFSLIKGFGHIFSLESPDAILLEPSFMQGIRKLRDYGFSYDLSLHLRHFPIVEELLKSVAETPIALNHMAMPMVVHHLRQPWEYSIKKLAKYPQVVCKLSGLGRLFSLKEIEKDYLRIYLDILLENFGMDRLLMASDWPFARHIGEYAQATEWIDDYFSQFSKEEQIKIMRENSKKFYNL